MNENRVSEPQIAIDEIESIKSLDMQTYTHRLQNIPEVDDNADETAQLQWRASPECTGNRSPFVLLNDLSLKASKGLDVLSSRYLRIVGDRTFGMKNFKTGRPLAICIMFVKRPYFWFGFTLGIQLFFMVLSLILYFVGYNILPHNFETHPLYMLKSNVYRQYLAWEHRFASSAIYKRKPAAIELNPLNPYMKPRSATDLLATIIFETHENILTKENLAAIQYLENQVYYEPEYQAKYCDMLANRQCLKPLSLIRFFDGTFRGINATFYDPSFDNIPVVISEAFNNNITKGLTIMLIGKDFDKTTSTRITQSFLYINNTRDPKEYLIEKWYDYFKGLVKNGYKGMIILQRNEHLITHEIFDTMVVDFIWIVASVSFVFLFMWIQTSSLFLTFWGVFSTLTSFVTSNFIYNIVFDYQYFGVFQILSIFVTLGIAVDDVFIFCDTWKALSLESYPSLAHRLSACFYKSSSSMFVTSLATAAAFFFNALNPILAVSSFGAYSAVVILTNYISVVLFYPNVVLVYHLRVGKMCNCNRRCDETGCRCKGCKPVAKNDQVDSGHLESETSDLDIKKPTHRLVVRILSGPYFRLVDNRVFQVCVLTFYAAIISVLAYYLTKLTADEKPPQIFRKGHPSDRFLEKSATAFYKQDVNKLIKVAIVWGIHMQDVTRCHPREFKVTPCSGKTSWKPDFDLNNEVIQWTILKMCRKLHGMSFEEAKRLRIRINPMNGRPTFRCPFLVMDRYFKKEQASNMSFNVTKIKGKQFIASHPNLYNISGKHFTRFFETMYAYWITNGHGTSKQLPTDQALYANLVGELQNTTDFTRLNPPHNDYFGTRIGVTGVEVTLDVSWDRFYYKDGLDLYKKWVKFVEKESKNDAFMTSTRHEWHFYHVVSQIVSQCYISIAAGILLAWGILVASSGNYIVGTMATLCIFAVVVCVLGAIPLGGWKLGILEALNTTLVVGLSVDYVVHMGIAYNHSGREDRKGRVQYALEHMGVSVLSGALTTLGCSFFMLFTQIAFFGQFATFMLLTIGISILVALTLFMVLLIVVGPQGNTGSNKILISKIKRLFAKTIRNRKARKSKRGRRLRSK